MSLELNLNSPSPGALVVTFDGDSVNVSFAAFQEMYPVASAVKPALRTVLNDNLTSEEEVITALRATSVLLILDNLESLRDGEDRQTELLDAAVGRSRDGQTRILHFIDHPEAVKKMMG